MKYLLVFGLAILSETVVSLPSSLTSRSLQPVVETSIGRIHGINNENHPTVSQFLNIPFAKPPLGQFRFAPPQALDESQDAFVDATKFGSVCLQYNPSAAQTVLYSQYNTNYLPKEDVVQDSSEDCLSLAIWTPSSACRPGSKANFPVLVWFFGGGFTKGGINTTYYDPSPWIERTQSHIVVAVNYRTNIAGTPNAAGLARQGKNYNVGLMDQRFAVQWVHKNIRNFGGDSSKITIWGQSAGSISVDLYNFAYLDDGLVAGLIMSSGTAMYPRSNIDLTSSNFSYVAAGLGCPAEDPEFELQCMRKIPSDQLKAFIQRLDLPTTLDPYPVVDNVTKFPAASYPERILSGKSSKKPAIIGSTSLEGNAYIPLAGPVFPNTTLRSLSDGVTDSGFLCPAINETAIRDAAGLLTYRYLYNGNFSNISPEPWQGAYHASELSLVFGTYDLPTEPGNPTDITDFQRRLSEKMQDLWLAFMNDPVNGPGKLGWPTSRTSKGGILKFAPAGLPDGPVLAEVVSADELGGVCL